MFEMCVLSPKSSLVHLRSCKDRAISERELFIDTYSRGAKRNCWIQIYYASLLHYGNCLQSFIFRSLRYYLLEYFI